MRRIKNISALRGAQIGGKVHIVYAGCGMKPYSAYIISKIQYIAVIW
ncbi:hypothetical protein AB32_4888 [Escherichia coli 2-316-03_S1_C2]|jgi:hypothetical protein|nr:hypothetical protein HMPREF9534_02401 [Escherichia coli MS 69-1]ESA77745.1 hypothetical protein HMPREF1588_00978 [Escherichia coli 110957]ESD30004.1 hypothetical protein HMPREF1600_00971 [Escherichia coli 907715]ESD54963.1 hypothetical protein HMPREF1605_02157 [Escherichia coli 908521]ESD85638.1 hypothetical protein HMPREF1611_02467 [Escherichia coli 908573]ESD92745.1 hypothetical protein HMPREF1612_01461 [Escherichia coli 908585]ESD96363.1 hypothetical protein HMPREF1613_00232 [Escherichi